MVSVDSGNTAELGGDTRSVHDSDFVDASLAATFEVPDGNRLGDFELVGELGRGGMGVVYDARHVKTGNRVALKTLPMGHGQQAIDANKLYRFRKEFRVLSEVNHPNLVGMQTLEVDGSQWFFTMDLIDGQDFLSYVRPQGELDEQRLRSSLPQLVSGVLALHNRGIVHRDLKPGNVLVSESGRVSVLDFGLVAEMQKTADMTQTRSGMFAGTPRYAAPEQMFGERTEASDWYALGTMIYEALTGSPPFVGKNHMAVLRQKQQEDPPTLSEVAECPSDLAGLVEGLIQREPEKRLMADEICACLDLDEDTRLYGSTVPSKGSHASSGSVDDESDLEHEAFENEEVVLIGREKQLAQLEEIKQEFLKTKQPSVVWVTGLSGEGKSSLVEKFLQPIRKNQEMLVLSGRCYDRESVPFKVIDSQIAPLVRYLNSLPEDLLKPMLPDGIEMLAQLFPALNRVKDIQKRAKSKISGLDERQVRNLAFSALGDLLREMAQKKPLVLFVDDLQWGDGDSARVLLELLSNDRPPGVMLIGSFRSDEKGASPFLQEFLNKDKLSNSTFSQHEVVVSPLTKEECWELFNAKFGVDAESRMDAEQARYLIKDTKGNPYFLEQMLEGYDVAKNEFMQSSVPDLLDAKVKRCPSGTRQLLEIISVAGKAVSLTEIVKLLGESKSVISTLTHMRNERLVRLMGSPGSQTVDTYHDKIRETALKKISKDKRQSLHLQLAEFLESVLTLCESNNEKLLLSDKERVFDIAHHFYHAEDPRAFDYQLKAAGKALHAYAMENALDHLLKAEELLFADASADLKFKLNFMFAEAYAGCGDAVHAIARYHEALGFADCDKRRALCLYQLSEVHWKHGDIKLGMKRIDDSLALIHRPLPKSIVAKLTGTFWALFQFHFLPKFLIWSNRGRSAPELAKISKMYASENWKLTQLDPLLYLYLTAMACVFAKHCEDAHAKYQSYMLYTALTAFIGCRFFSRWPLHKALKCTQEISETEALGPGAANLGCYYYIVGDLKRADEVFAIAASKLDRTNHYQRTMPRHFLWHIASVRGRTNDIVYYSKKEIEIAESSADKIMLSYGRYGLAEGLAKMGEIKQAKDLARQARDYLDSINGTMICVADVQMARVLNQAGEFSAARAASVSSIKKIIKFCFFEISASAFPLFVEAVLADNWAIKEVEVDKKELRKARWSLRVARLSSVCFPNIRPYSIRMRGRCFAATGKTEKAVRCFDLAANLAGKNQALAEYARALIDKSVVKGENWEEDRSKGIRLLESLGCVLPDVEIQYLQIDRSHHYSRAKQSWKSEPGCSVEGFE